MNDIEHEPLFGVDMGGSPFDLVAGMVGMMAQGMGAPQTAAMDGDECVPAANDEVKIGGRNTQWATTDDKVFQGVGRSVNELTPGAYMIKEQRGVIYFVRFDLETDNLLLLPGTVLSEVVTEISNFWGLYDHYKSYGIRHRRGILIGGPAGSGKSSTLKLVAADVIKRHGIVIPYSDPNLLLAGMSLLREIQPKTPVVVMMEDLDEILSQAREGQSAFLNMLDGIMSDAMDMVVFMATTNHFDRLERRITNRPSRFDRVFAVDNPNEDARFAYLQHLFTGKVVPDWFSCKQVAADTDKLSFAHLKEIVTSTVIMGNKYETVLANVKEMAESELPSGDEMEHDPYRGQLGFTNNHRTHKIKRSR